MHHGAGLRTLTGSDALARALVLEPASADLLPPDRAMLEYALKLTRAPADVTADDVDALREAGFDDTGILDVCQVVSYYNYVNRLADGLGVELEDYWTDEAMCVTRDEFQAGRTNRG